MESEQHQIDIELVVRAKSYIVSLPLNLQNADYIEIIKRIDLYLIQHCQHVIVTDTIDIDPDQSQTIHYCEKCLHTFQ